MEQNYYTHGHHESVLRSHRWRTVENSAAYLLPHLEAGMELLDVGCGPGTMTTGLARRVAPGRAVGVDNAQDVLADARENAADNLTYEHADVYALPYPDDSFDVVHAHQVLQHVTDPVAALREMRRVCRPGGIVAARDADYGGMRWHPDHPGLDTWLDLYRRVAKSNGAEPDAGRRLLAWAQRAGFTDIECGASAWCYATPEERSWWGGLWADRVRYSRFAEQAVTRGLATDDTLTAIARAWQDWIDAPDGWFGILNTEVLCRP